MELLSFIKIIFKFRKFFCLKGTQIMAKNNFPETKHVRLIFFHVRRKKKQQKRAKYNTKLSPLMD